MEKKTIAYILIGTALVGITVGGIIMVKKSIDKKKDKQKKATQNTNAAYSVPTPVPSSGGDIATHEQPQPNETPQPNEAPVQNTPKPKPKPQPKPQPSTSATRSIDLGKNLFSPSRDSNAGVKKYLEIQILQMYLNKYGYGLGVDGVLGKNTRKGLYKAMGKTDNGGSLNISLKSFFDACPKFLQINETSFRAFAQKEDFQTLGFIHLGMPLLGLN